MQCNSDSEASVSYAEEVYDDAENEKVFIELEDDTQKPGKRKSRAMGKAVDKNKPGDSKPDRSQESSSDDESMFNPEKMTRPKSSEWYPPNKVAKYIEKRLRKPLHKDTRYKMKSECPRPSVSNKVAETPAIDPKVLAFAGKNSRSIHKGIERSWRNCQDRLLDVVGPLAKILEMSEQSKDSGQAIDPEALAGWAQRALCFLGNANCAISAERRKSILLKINPKLVELAAGEPGPLADGLLFGNEVSKEIGTFVKAFNSKERSKMTIQRISPKKVYDKAGRGRGRSTSWANYASSQGGGRGGFQTQTHQPTASPFFPSRSRGQRGRGFYDQGVE